MTLGGEHLLELREALLAAFPSPDDLKSLVQYSLELNIYRISTADNLTVVAEKLIEWAVANERVDDLLNGAEAKNPGNPRLKQFAATYRAAKAAATTQRQLLPPAVAPAPAAPEYPLIDRQEMVQWLAADVATASNDRRGRSRVLIGDSGVGKTRLAQHLEGVAGEAGMFVVKAQCVGARAQALQPVRDALSSLDPHPAGEALSPAPGGKDVYEGLARTLLGLGDDRGVCLVVEDLTDADEDTLYFLEHLSRKGENAPLLTVSTVKKDFVAEPLRDLLLKWEGNGWEVADVPPLPPQYACEFISQRWSGEPLPDDRIKRILDLTGGNPFFMEQVLDLLQERADDPTVDIEVTGVPKPVEAVLRRRLERLDDDTLAFLEAASVALEAANRIELIGHVAGIEDERTAYRLLRRACEEGCLSEDPHGGIAFVQGLLHQVVYDRIPEAARRRMHGRAGDWLRGEGLLKPAAHHLAKAARYDDLVEAALEGAHQAERSGTYRAAVELYELARPHADLTLLGPRLAKAYIVIGKPEDAGDVLDQLPFETREVRVLRSEICFVRGDFRRALEEMELALQAAGEDRVDTLIRLADINLYLGRLAKAAEYASEASAQAKDPALIARCKGLRGAASFFGGDVDEGERLYREALAVLAAQPVEQRDRGVYTIILGNLGDVNEVRGRWEEALRLHDEALSLRRAVSDARGELHSLHSLALCQLGLGSIDEAVGSLEEARKLAVALEERLEQGKIEHSFARVALRRGDPAKAVDCAQAALDRFDASRVAYDITHARFTLARGWNAAGKGRRGIEEGARARRDLQRNGFGLLMRLFPDLGFSWDDRIHAGLLAYAAGDALGLPWEGTPPEAIDPSRIHSIPETPNWPSGATSDDTALTLLVVEYLAGMGTGTPDPTGLLQLLVGRAPTLEGLGPSTTAAIDHFRSTGAPPIDGGDTNGAVMRALPVGWAVPLNCAPLRRDWAIALSRATHPGPAALCAACTAAACAAWALEGAGPDVLLEVAREEAAATARRCGADDRLEGMLSALLARAWFPSPSGVTLDPCETLVSALWCLATEPSLPDALLRAVRLGGDTDTTAALVGGLLGCRLPSQEVAAQLPWLEAVRLPEPSVRTTLATGLADLRLRLFHD